MADQIARKLNNVVVFKAVTADDPFSHANEETGWSAETTLQSALNSASGDDLYICDGVYDDTDLSSVTHMLSFAANNQSVIGQSRTGTILQTPATYSVVDDGERTGCWLKNMTVKQTGTTPTSTLRAVEGGSGQIHTENVTFSNTGRIYRNGTNETNHYNPMVIDHKGDLVGWSNTSTDAVMNLFNPIIDYSSNWPIYGESNAITNIYGGVIIGSQDQVFRLNNTSVCNCYNTCFGPNTQGAEDMKGGAGTLNLYDCSYLYNFEYPLTRKMGADNETRSYNFIPQFRSARRECFVVLQMDDSNNWTDWTDMADYAETKGFTASIAVHAPRNFTNYGTWAEMVEYINRGHEIVSHGNDYRDLAVLTALDITGPAGSTLTVTVSGADLPDVADGTGTLVASDGSDHTITLNYTKTMSDVAIEIQALDGWSASMNADDEISPYMPSVCLDDAMVADAYNSGSGVTLSADKDRAWFWLLIQVKIDLETQVRANGISDWECKTFTAYGSNADPDEIRAFIADPDNYPSATNPYTSARINGGGRTLADDIVTGRDGVTAGLDLYDINRYFLNDDTGVDDIEAVAGTYLVWGAWIGAYMIFTSHGYNEVGRPYSAENWEELIDTVAKVTGVSVRNPSEIAEHITSSGLYTETSSGSDIWVRTYDYGADYRLKSTSELINAGKFVAGGNEEGQADPWGKYVHKLPNIGVDQGAGAPKGGQRWLSTSLESTF